MKKILLSYLQRCPGLFKANIVRNTFLLIGFIVMSLSGFAQGPGHPNVDAGQDVTLDCGGDCTDLTASYLHTGDTSTYSVSSIPYAPPFPFTGGTPVSVNIDDRWSPAVTLPFEFCFYGQVYTQMVIGSNAVISFDLGQNNPNTYCEWSFSESIPNPNLFHTAIFGPYMDVDPSIGGSGTINWTVFGTTPNRTMVVNFPSIPYYGSACVGKKLTSQVVIYETTNAVEVYIENRPGGCSWNDGYAVVGIQNQDGTIGETAPGRNTGNWTATNEAWRFTPNGAPNVEFSWLDADGNVIGTNTTIHVCPTEPVTTYTAQAIYTNCNGDIVVATDDVTVNLLGDFDITLDLGPDLAFCDVPSYEIVPQITGDTTGATYLWSPGGETTPTITVTDSDTYTLEISRDGCSVTSSVTIGFFDNPIIDLGPDIQTCFQNPVILDASPTNYPNPMILTYEWSLDGTVITGAIGPTLNITQTGTYSVIVTIGDCVATDEITVSTEGEFDLGGDQDLCDAEDYEITVEFISGDPNDATFLWNTGETTQSITVTDSGTYSVEVIIYNCTMDSEVTINFYDTPIFDLGGDITTCFNNPVILDATPSNHYDDPNDLGYEWTLNGNVITGATDATLQVTEVGTYGVTVTAGTCTAYDEVVVSNQDGNIDLGGDQELCDFEDYVITVDFLIGDATNATFLWNTGETTQSITVTESGTYSVEVQTSDCTLNSEVTINFYYTPNIDLGEDISTCFLDPVILDATPSNYDASECQYEWTYNGTILTNETSSTLEVADIGTYGVTVTIGSCVATDSVTVSMGASPDVAIGEDFEICPNEPHTLTATTSVEGATYQWFLNATEIAGETGNSIEIVLEPGTMGTQTYSVIVTVDGCVGTASVDARLYPVGNCIISQGISPNGDGFNDTLDLTFLNDRTGIKKLQIFNRLGTLVFDKTNYTNEWAGQTNGGDDLPTGTYFYVIDLNGNDAVYGKQHTGWIYLNREAN